jgi:hypothetical protein
MQESTYAEDNVKEGSYRNQVSQIAQDLRARVRAHVGRTEKQCRDTRNFGRPKQYHRQGPGFYSIFGPR